MWTVIYMVTAHLVPWFAALINLAYFCRVCWSSCVSHQIFNDLIRISVNKDNQSPIAAIFLQQLSGLYRLYDPASTGENVALRHIL
jgi:hypothetical protein